MSNPEFNFPAVDRPHPWQEGYPFGAVHLRKIIAKEKKRAGEVLKSGKSGRLGLSAEGKALSGKIFEKIMNEGPYSPLSLGSFWQGAEWFCQKAEDPAQKLLGRSLLAKTGYQVRRIICQIEAEKRGEEAPRSAAEVFRRTKGLDLKTLNYEDLESRYRALLFDKKLDRVLAKETVGRRKQIGRKLSALGAAATASWLALGEKVSSSVELTKKAVPVALAALALIGLGFGLHRSSLEKAGKNVQAPERVAAGSAHIVGSPPPPTLIFKTPTISETPTVFSQSPSVAEAGPIDLPLTGAEKQAAGKGAKINLSAGERFVLEGPVFKNQSFLLKAVSPSLAANFNFDEAVVCGYELSEEGPTVIVIHAGRRGEQILPGERLKAAEKGGKMLVATEKGEIKTSLLGAFRVPSDQFKAEAETLAALARQNGISLSGKCLLVVTCDGWNSADSTYLEKEVLVFGPGSSS